MYQINNVYMLYNLENENGIKNSIHVGTAKCSAYKRIKYFEGVFPLNETIIFKNFTVKISWKSYSAIKYFFKSCSKHSTSSFENNCRTT